MRAGLNGDLGGGGDRVGQLRVAVDGLTNHIECAVGGPTDPATFLGVALLLGGVAIAAALVPARRATQVNPVEVLSG